MGKQVRKLFGEEGLCMQGKLYIDLVVVAHT